MSPELFPVEASAKAKELIDVAVKAAVKAWGAKRSCCGANPAVPDCCAFESVQAIVHVHVPAQSDVEFWTDALNCSSASVLQGANVCISTCTLHGFEPNYVKLAGERQLTELEAEERLAFACEKAPTDDETSQQVRRRKPLFRFTWPHSRGRRCCLACLHIQY